MPLRGSFLLKPLRFALLIVASTLLLAAMPADLTPVGLPETVLNRISDPLLRILAFKGIMTTEDILDVLAVDEGLQRGRLAALLVKRGVLTEADVREAGQYLPPLPLAAVVAVVPAPPAVAIPAV